MTGPAWRHRGWLGATLVAVTAPAWAALDPVVVTRLDDDLRCQLGAYTLSGGRHLTITGADGQPRGLRYLLWDGRFGELKTLGERSFEGPSLRVAFEPCSAGQLRLTVGSRVESGVRQALVERPTDFMSDGHRLHGKLVLPAGGAARALAVWIEGSNNNPSTDDSVWPYELARRGVAVFVHDKRGTGASAGAPSSDFVLRARDTAAALAEARRLAPGIRRVGIIGASQGGWVAPLVAQRVPLDFLIAAYATAEGPIAQDRAIVAQQLQDAGFDDDVRRLARELTALTERIVRSNLREGLDELEAFKARHAGAAWLGAIQPRSYTGLFLRFSADDIRTHGPGLAQGLSFDHDSRPIVAAIRPRQLWLLGGQDRQAPNEVTQGFLKQLQQRRRPVAVAVFVGADHGLVDTVRADDEVTARYVPRLFDVTAEWILHNRLPSPGRFIRLRSPAGTAAR